MSYYRGNHYSKGYTQVQYVAKTSNNQEQNNTEERPQKSRLSAQSQEFNVPTNNNEKFQHKRGHKKHHKADQRQEDNDHQNRRQNNGYRGKKPQREKGDSQETLPHGSRKGLREKREKEEVEESKNQRENSDERQNNSDENVSDGEIKELEDFTKIPKSELAEILKDRFMKNQIECPICYNKIKKDAKIWSCQQCYGPFHLSCIGKWIQKNPANSDNGKPIPNLKYYTWSCPKCNYNYSEEYPEYKCFCHKVVNPDYDPYSIPHSCGDTCGKKRGKFCIHSCNLPCHPGPCPPCNLLGKEQSCFCGSVKVKVRCSDESTGFSCGKICGKTLSCGKHTCSSKCHEGPCSKCDIQVTSSCYCGKQTEERSCGQEAFSCHQVCGKSLDCGNHKCNLVCHDGPCPSCKYTPERMTTCCCGRMSVSSLGFSNRKSCLDPIPICGLPCGKLLPCGHQCKKSCHPYDCDNCKELVVQKCRCGKSERKIECWKTQKGDETERTYLCDRICRKLKSCKTHKCQRVCCDATKGNDPDGHHLCLKVCGKLLNCGKHTCEDFCHLGDCKQCPIIINYPLSCTCGKTVKYPPLQCGTKLPECNEPCSRKKECGHPCHLKCHYDECPPCEELIEKMCDCGRKLMKNIKCSKNANCLVPCDTMLACGHKCGIVCHAGPCDMERGIKGCGAKCGKPRTCGHKCEALCHPGQECPNDPCKVLVKIKCECGNRETFIKCSEKETSILNCDKSCANMKRFGAFLKRDENKKSYYPPTLVRFAKNHLSYLLRVEDKLEKMFKEGKESVDIPLYDKNMGKKSALQTLISRHYNMDLEFYLHVKDPKIIVKTNQNSRLPSMTLSEYLRQIETGKIKPEILPFEATIKFFNVQQTDSIDELEFLIKEFEGEYYLERNELRQIMLHFWSKPIAEEALTRLKKSYSNFSQAALEENTLLKAEEEKIKATEEDVIKTTENEQKKEDEAKSAFLFLSLNNQSK